MKRVAIVLLIPLFGLPAAGQVPPLLKRVDPTLEDLDPLATSLRELQVELAEPVDFEHVYRVPGHESLLMRAHGGIYATFPRAVYANSRFGPVPVIPPDTIFYIGRPGLQRLGAGPQLRSVADGASDDGRLQWRVDMQPLPTGQESRQRVTSNRIHPDPIPDTADDPVADERVPPPPDRPTMLTDRLYRADRIRELMARAAAQAKKIAEEGG